MHRAGHGQWSAENHCEVMGLSFRTLGLESLRAEVGRELVEVEVAVLRPGAAEWQAGETVKSHEEDRR